MFKNMSRTAITNLFNEAPTRFLTNEISIFKLKYNQMVLDNKLNRPGFGDSDDAEPLDDFIFGYVVDLTDDQRNSIINTYGVLNAMDLLYTWYHRCTEKSDDEIKSEMETSSIDFIVGVTITVILYDAIGAHMEWKYL